MQAPTPTRRRRLLTWAVSLLGGAGFLWLASGKLELWPTSFAIAAPELVIAAVALYLPYALLRAHRLAFVLDPIVDRSSTRPDGPKALDRRVLYGSGLLSFFVLLALPLKLGELSRPLLLAKARQPGVRLTEAISAVATERIVDGLLICAMLFGGLALARVDDARALADVNAVGRGMSGLFLAGFVGLVLAARAPERAAAWARRLARPLGSKAAERLASLVQRFAEPFAAVLQMRRGLGFAGVSIAYWAVTVVQLWLVARGCGLPLGLPEAAAIVAFVGLSIQLPGGPAQAGIYQFGTGMALGLFLAPEVVRGPGSTFTASMYALQFVGAAVLALPGLWLLARVPPEPEPEPEPETLETGPTDDPSAVSDERRRPPPAST